MKTNKMVRTGLIVGMLGAMMFSPKVLASSSNEGWEQIESGWQYIQEGRPLQNQWLFTGNKRGPL